MASYVLQMGHVPRTAGDTGAPGEQEYARRVAAEAAAHLLVLSHTPIVLGADDPIPRSDGFCAIHADGSANPAARGASYGYQ